MKELLLFAVLAFGSHVYAGVKIYEEILSARSHTLRLGLEGDITRQDADNFEVIWTRAHKAQAATNPPNQLFISMALNSKGGDVDSALRIGHLLRRGSHIADVLDRNVCYSSCVLILAGATRRSVQPTAKIGIHRPFLTKAVGMPAGQMDEFYKDLTIRIATYFDSVNINKKLAADMMRIPPERMSLLSRGQLDEYGLASDDVGIQESDAMAQALRLGISRRDLASRMNQANSVCGDSRCGGDHDLQSCFAYVACRNNLIERPGKSLR